MKKTIKLTVDVLDPLYFIKVDENLTRQVDKEALMRVPCRRIYTRKYILPPTTLGGLYRLCVHYVYSASKSNTDFLLHCIVPLQREHRCNPDELDDDLPF